MIKYCLLAAMAIPGFIRAQVPEKTKEAEQIIIMKKGGGADRLNIMIDGEKVTVNGTPVDRNSKDAEVTVTRRKIKDMDVWMDDAAPGQNRVRRYSFGSPQPPTAPVSPNKAMLGVGTAKSEGGVKVMSITGGSAAEAAGLKLGDIIAEVDRSKIETPDDLSKAIRGKDPGDKVTIVYLRDNKQYTTVASLKKWETPEMPAFENFNLQELPDFDTEALRRQLGQLGEQQDNLRQFRSFSMPAKRPRLGIKIQDVESGSGVKVIDVENGSDADKAGIRQGDIIKEVNGKTVIDADDMRLQMPGAGNEMQIRLDRNGVSRNIKVQFSKKIKTAEL